MKTIHKTAVVGVMLPFLLPIQLASATSLGDLAYRPSSMILAQAATDEEQLKQKEEESKAAPEAAPEPVPAAPAEAPAPKAETPPAANPAKEEQPEAKSRAERKPPAAPETQSAPAPAATPETAPRAGAEEPRNRRIERRNDDDRKDHRPDRKPPQEPAAKTEPAPRPPAAKPESPAAQPAAPTERRTAPPAAEEPRSLRQQLQQHDPSRRETRDERRPNRGDSRKVLEQENGRTVTQDGENRVIIRENNRIIINNNDSERLSRDAKDVRVDRRQDGNTVTTLVRPNGVEVTTVRDANGDIIRRTRTTRGQEVILIDDARGPDHRRGNRRGIGPIVQLPPLVLDIPRERYIVEANEAPMELIEETLIAPPVERVERAYSLGEIRNNYRVLEKVRSVDINTITFEFGAWEIQDDQIDRLETIGSAIEQIIRKDPDEVFLIEGHTDAVGSNEDNLALSDRRAESIAIILTEHFDIPAENLITQGYGEEQLRVKTQREERENRRVTLRRITPLLAAQGTR